MNKNRFLALFFVACLFPMMTFSMEEQIEEESFEQVEQDEISDIGIIFGEDSDSLERPDEVNEKLLMPMPHYVLENGLRAVAIGPKRLIKTLEFLYRNGQLNVTDAQVAMPPRRSATSHIVPMSIKEFISYKELLATGKSDLENKIGNFKRKRKETLKKEILHSTLLVASGLYFLVSKNIEDNQISLVPFLLRACLSGSLCTLPYKFVRDMIINSDKFYKKEYHMTERRLRTITAMSKIIEIHENTVSLSGEHNDPLESIRDDETLVQFKDRIKNDANERKTLLLRFALREGGLINTLATLHTQKKLKIKIHSLSPYFLKRRLFSLFQ